MIKRRRCCWGFQTLKWVKEWNFMPKYYNSYGPSAFDSICLESSRLRPKLLQSATEMKLTTSKKVKWMITVVFQFTLNSPKCIFYYLVQIIPIQHLEVFWCNLPRHLFNVVLFFHLNDLYYVLLYPCRIFLVFNVCAVSIRALWCRWDRWPWNCVWENSVFMPTRGGEMSLLD